MRDYEFVIRGLPHEFFVSLHKAVATHNGETDIEEFSTLWPVQKDIVVHVVTLLFDSLSRHSGQSIVVHGDHKCGKTTVALYLLAYLAELQRTEPNPDPRLSVMMDNVFAMPPRKEPHELRFALVVPDPDTREAIRAIVAEQPGMREDMVLGADEVAKSPQPFDLLIVDDAHLLKSNADVVESRRRDELIAINKSLFGEEVTDRHEFDWIRTQSAHRVIFVDDAGQPEATPGDVLKTEMWNAQLADLFFTL